MQILATSGWEDYELLDTGDGHRLERFGKYTLVRPDPQIIWKPRLANDVWQMADGIFTEDKKWQNKNNVPEKWLLEYKNLKFYCKLSPFKHTGVFPEQHLQWDWIKNKLKTQMSNLKSIDQNLKILNLFAYTGIASLICADADTEVTHVDASRPTIAWAKENQMASGLSNKPIRWILDDAIKFTEREIKRGVRYDAIIMDPPVYGHGPNGEKWNFNYSFPKLLEICKQVLSDDPIFVLVNAYAISSSALMLENCLKDFAENLGGQVESGELVLEERSAKRLLSTGIFSRWSKTK